MGGATGGRSHTQAHTDGQEQQIWRTSLKLTNEIHAYMEKVSNGCHDSQRGTGKQLEVYYGESLEEPHDTLDWDLRQSDGWTYRELIAQHGTSLHQCPSSINLTISTETNLAGQQLIAVHVTHLSPPFESLLQTHQKTLHLTRSCTAKRASYNKH